MHYHLQNFLIIDIETVSGHESIEKISPELKKHWEHKTLFIRNPDEKSSEELYRDCSAIYAEFGKIIVIGMAFYYGLEETIALKVKSIASHDEKELLTEFKNFINSKFNHNSLKLCAHNGKEFDFPYLCRRMLVNGIQIPNSLNITGKKPWEVNHIDTMELWKFGDRKNFTPLDLLTTIFNIPSSKQELDGSKVTKTYYEQEDGLNKIEDYCKRDVIATAQLYLRLNNLPLVSRDHIHIVT